jgi:hypothetical protein
MKKLIHNGLFLALVGFTIVSCRKSGPIPNKVENTRNKNASIYGTPKSGFDSEFQLGNEGRFLVFNNEDGYAHAVDNPSEVVMKNLYSRMLSLNHYSWQDYLVDNPNEGMDTLIKDDYFASILSKDKTVQIGQHIFKINPENEKVYALHVKNVEHYGDLISNNENSPLIRVFSFNDDVLESIKNNSGNGNSDIVPGLFCNDRYAVEKSASTNEVFIVINPEVKMKLKVLYEKGGIYSSLRAEGTHTKVQNSDFRFYFQLDNCSYMQRCGSTVSNYSHPWRNKTSGADLPSNSKQLEYFKFYSGVKRLKEYNFNVRFRCENLLQPSSSNPYTIYYTTYAHIED